MSGEVLVLGAVGGWRRPLTEPENLKHLIGPYLIDHASALPVPRDAASPVAVAWVLPAAPALD